MYHVIDRLFNQSSKQNNSNFLEITLAYKKYNLRFAMKRRVVRLG